MSKNQVIILSILLVYLLANIVIAILYGRKKVSASAEKKYFIGGRTMGGLVLAMTVMATYASVSSFISGPGAAGMTYGYAQVWVAAVQVPVVFLTMGVLGNKFALVARRTGSITVAGYLKARYKSDALVIVTSLLLVVFFMAQMVAQFTGGATLIQSITGLDYKWALIIFAATVVIYTSFGGFSAVAITDTIQGLIMCVGTFLFIFFVLKAGGGLEGIDAGLQEALPGKYDNLTAVYSPGALLSFWILVGFGTIGLPQTAVRAMGYKGSKDLHKAMIIGTIVCAVIMVGMHLAGTWAGALVDDKQLLTSDYFIPYIVQKIMPVGLAGIFLAAPMAAVMSTADSLLLLVSATILRELWKTYVVKDNPVKLEKYNKNISKTSVLTTFIVGVVLVYFSLNPPDIIFALNLFALGGLECAFFWPIVGGLFWKKGTKEAALVSSIGAVVVYIFSYYNVKILGINAVVWGLLFGGIMYFVTGMCTSKNGLDEDVLINCF
ncbi:MAG: sodium/pantothenate symporter [Sphaerochaetaceae bacterium]|nr:sodium/pantothenate symporter [Sphaerochaetaceae bacterium]